MSKDRTIVLDVDELSRGNKHRHSLQPQSEIAITQVESNFRHTQSQNYDSKKQKRARLKSPELHPPIKELESPSEEDKQFDDRVYISATNESVRISKSSTRSNEKKIKRNSRESKRSRSNSTAYDNAAFDGDIPKKGLTRSNSATNSIRSRSSSQSVQTVVREQYWCCSQRTPCERTLIACIGVLSVIILILIIVIIVIATNGKNDTAKKILSTFKV